MGEVPLYGRSKERLTRKKHDAGDTADLLQVYRGTSLIRNRSADLRQLASHVPDTRICVSIHVLDTLPRELYTLVPVLGTHMRVLDTVGQTHVTRKKHDAGDTADLLQVLSAQGWGFI